MHPLESAAFSRRTPDQGLCVGLAAPAGTPDEIVQKLSSTIGEIMRDEKVGKSLRDVGNEPIGSSPAELDKYWKSEIDLYRKIVTDAGIKLEQ